MTKCLQNEYFWQHADENRKYVTREQLSATHFKANNGRDIGMCFRLELNQDNQMEWNDMSCSYQVGVICEVLKPPGEGKGSINAIRKEKTFAKSLF